MTEICPDFICCSQDLCGGYAKGCFECLFNSKCSGCKRKKSCQKQKLKENKNNV